MSEVLTQTLENGVLTLTMNRPEVRNALNDEMGRLLTESLQAAAENPDVRVVVLTGAGQAFCSGGDVKSMAANPGRGATPDGRVRSLRRRADATRLLHEMNKPTVAVIRGAAAGAGLALALGCDFRLALPDAKMTTAFGKVGLAGDYGMSYFLPRLVGGAKARELLMLSPLLTAKDALALNLVTRVFEGAEFEAKVAEFVNALASGPTITYGYMKDNLNDAMNGSLTASIEGEAQRQVRCMATADHAEASKAFVEKRAPVFKGE
ncbi:enoyl-CoA hydratase [Comamonas serinivorans]|uniref:Enoyl-CoA hydratase n=1 Tax=Comamonas serinivorans TaxID=1082851 RepID=A0A1Y0ET52_9BURK|nr:enoyl-CoA hydratase [Comamonas serinivorans]ARU06580.1 enoyl-CoA hydratase [Comamonas serinivorans]